MEALMKLFDNPAFAKLLTAGAGIYTAKVSGDAMEMQSKALKQNMRQNSKLFEDDQKRNEALKNLDFTAGYNDV